MSRFQKAPINWGILKCQNSCCPLIRECDETLYAVVKLELKPNSHSTDPTVREIAEKVMKNVKRIWLKFQWYHIKGCYRLGLSGPIVTNAWSSLSHSMIERMMRSIKLKLGASAGIVVANWYRSLQVCIGLSLKEAFQGFNEGTIVHTGSPGSVHISRNAYEHSRPKPEDYSTTHQHGGMSLEKLREASRKRSSWRMLTVWR